ncbi:MAG: GIY-YIG nuclease family protein [Planctomycetes bacterium]|nr:GIY-YIG nuclease family protein [Planctomycetota bacterium]
MWYVHSLQSRRNPNRFYIGLTDELDERLAQHNAGESPHSSKFAPWSLVVAVLFSDLRKAQAFERYLKSGSGRAFAKRHF